MQFGLGHLLLFSALLPAVTAEPTKNRIQPRQNSDEEVIAHFSEQGTCFDYVKDGPREKALEPCKKYCKDKEDSDSYGCASKMTQEEKDELPSSSILEDDDGNGWVPGECHCDFAVVEEIVDVVAEGLGKLDNVICAVFSSAFMSIADIGSNFIPGAGQARAVGRAVEGAKTFAENGMGGGSMFTSWIGPACGLDDFEFDINKVFMGLTGMPDSLGTSKGCKKKKKSSCKKPDPVPDPPKSKKPDDEKPTSTKSAEPSQSSTDEPADTCKISKRDTKNKCLDDSCANIEPWPKDIQDLGYDSPGGAEKRSIRGTGFFGLEERANGVLDPRGKDSNIKKITICGTTYSTDKYPRGGELIGNTVGNKPKDYMDKSIFALKDPKSCGDFDFDRRNNDLFDKTYKDLRGNLGLAAEHVLEAQTITDFFDHLDQTLKKDFPDPYNPDDSVKVGFCDYMKAFWSTQTNVEWPTIDNVVNPAGKFLADQFPTDKKWRNEFFLLPGGVNGLKGKAWGMGIKEIVSSTAMKAVKDKDYDFLKVKSITQSEFQKEIIKFKDMINLNVYHSNSDVQDILKTQAGRVETMLEKVETEMAKIDFKKRNKQVQRGYESQGLSQKWKEFIKKEADDMQSKVDKFFSSYGDKFTEARKDMEKKAKTLDDKKNNKNKKDEEEQKKYEDMIAYIKSAEQKRSSMKKLSNPF